MTLPQRWTCLTVFSAQIPVQSTPWWQTRFLTQTYEWLMYVYELGLWCYISRSTSRFTKFPFLWALKSAILPIFLFFSLSLSVILLSINPLLYFSLFHFKTMLLFLCTELDTQQLQPPLGCQLWLGGLAQAGGLFENAFLDNYEKAAVFFLFFFNYYFIYFIRTLITHPLICAFVLSFSSHTCTNTHPLTHKKSKRWWDVGSNRFIWPW